MMIYKWQNVYPETLKISELDTSPLTNEAIQSHLSSYSVENQCGHVVQISQGIELEKKSWL